MDGAPQHDDAISVLLVVDDYPENLVSMRALLQRDDWRVITAASGLEALELLLAHDVDLVLLDVRMPGMDGFEVARLMRGSQRTRMTQAESELHAAAWRFHLGPEPVRIRRMLERPFGSVRWKEAAPDPAADVVIPLPATPSTGA